MKITINDCKGFYRAIKDRVGKNVSLIYEATEEGITFYWFSPDNVAFITISPEDVDVEGVDGTQTGEIDMYDFTTLINKGKADDKVVMVDKSNRFDVEIVGSKDLGMELPIHTTTKDPEQAKKVLDNNYGEIVFVLSDNMLSDGIDMIKKSGNANDSIILKTHQDGDDTKVTLSEANTQTKIRASSTIPNNLPPITTRFKRDYLCDLLEGMDEPSIRLEEEAPIVATDNISSWVIAPRID